MVLARPPSPAVGGVAGFRSTPCAQMMRTRRVAVSRARKESLALAGRRTVDLGSRRGDACAVRAQSVDEWVDEFTDLNDRKSDDPIALPTVSKRKRIILVRHGQSTWNAEGRMQGSSNNSELTARGKDQAKVTGDLLKAAKFDATFVSPLRRAQTTADIVWANATDKPTIVNALREIDLYSFQGLVKKEAEAAGGQTYETWKRQPAQFQIDGHYPVRELWHRASVAWQEMLEDDATNVLVVAHNAVNQALICSSVGLPANYFRRFVQSNGALTVLDFFPTPPTQTVPKVVIDRLNQAPASPSWSKHKEGSPSMKFILVRHASTDMTEGGIILGTMDESLNKKGKKQAKMIADFLSKLKVDKVFSSPTKRTVQSVYQLAKNQTHKEVDVTLKEKLANSYMGEWQGIPAKKVRGQPPPRDAETLDLLWDRTGEAWEDIIGEASTQDDKVVVVAAHAAVISAIICHALELSPAYTSVFRLNPGSMSVIEFPLGVQKGPGQVVTTNFLSHLGDFATSATLEADEEAELLDSETCGWDGCT